MGISKYDSGRCPDKSEQGICQHKDGKDNPCFIVSGREDMCPRGLEFKQDKAAQEEDAGER